MHPYRRSSHKKAVVIQSPMNPKHNKKRIIRLTQAHHITLKCVYRCFSNKRVRQFIDYLIEKYCSYFEIKIYHRAIVDNHIHLILLTKREADLHGFLRVFSGQLSNWLRKLKIIPKDAKNIWKSRPWSRVLEWGKAYGTAINYVALNYLEGVKRIARTHLPDEVRRHKRLIEEVLEKGLTKLPEKQLQLVLLPQ